MKIKKANLLISLIIVVSISAPLIKYGIVSAATLEVNTTGDASDNNPGDGTCDDGSGDCSLRAAIEEANAGLGTDTINFAIPGSGPHTITPSSSYDIYDTVIIDGITQAGASCGTLVPSLPANSNTVHNLKISIDGTNTNAIFNFSGFSPTNDASGSVVRGFDLINSNITYGAIAIHPDSGAVADNVQINCNYIGTDINGDVAQPNSFGLYVVGVNGAVITNNLISGNSSAAINSYGNNYIHHNLVGTNKTGLTSIANDTGILLGVNGEFSSNVISGNNKGINAYDASNVTSNLIGLNLKGTPLGNLEYGIKIRASSVNIGGGSNSGRNYISANGGPGVWIYSEENNGDGCSDFTTSDNSIEGNYIGTNINGEIENDYGNDIGVMINSKTTNSCSAFNFNNTIGGPNSGDGNIIAGNKKQGVLIYDDQSAMAFAKNNAVIGNSIFGNGDLGIDLAQDNDNDGIADTNIGPNSINSLLLSDSGFANHFINFPKVNSVSATDNKLTVNYNYIANPPGADSIVGYRLDFYLNEELDKSGYGQGKTHIGSFIIDGSATNANHTFILGEKITKSYFISTTATVLYEK